MQTFYSVITTISTIPLICDIQEQPPTSSSYKEQQKQISEITDKLRKPNGTDPSPPDRKIPPH